MLIDNSGNAWIPSEKIMSYTKFSYNLGKDVIIGNICNPQNWDEICSYLDRETALNSIENNARSKFISRISDNGKYNELIFYKKELEEDNITKFSIDGHTKKYEER